MSVNTKKPMTYLLGIAVLSIWGLIGYRLFAGSAEELPLPGAGKDLSAKTVALPQVMPDTFNLLLNYPDPFTGEKPKSRDTAVRPPVREARTTGPSAPMAVVKDPLDQVKYLGYVANGNGKERVAIVRYHGQEKMLKEGDTLGKIKVLEIKKERLMLGHGARRKLLKTE